MPVCFRTASGAQSCELLTPGDSDLRTPATDKFFANATGKGYYRTAYPADVYQDLVKQVESGLKPEERISLIGDEWAQLRSGKATVGDFMNLVSAVKADKSAPLCQRRWAAWNQFTAGSHRLKTNGMGWPPGCGPRSLRSTRGLGRRRPQTRQIRASCAPACLNCWEVMRRIRQSSPRQMRLPRSTLPTPHRATQRWARQRFRLPRGTVVRRCLRISEILRVVSQPELQVGALRLLAQFENPELAKRSLDYALSGKVRNQDAAIQFAIALQNPATRDLAWKYVQDNWDAIHALLTPEMGSILVVPRERSAQKMRATRCSSSCRHTRWHLPSVRRSAPSSGSTGASNCASCRSQACESGWSRTGSDSSSQLFTPLH